LATNGSRSDLLALFGKGNALAGDFCVEFLNGCNVLVDDRFIDKRP
jgi:hypothetical protein